MLHHYIGYTKIKELDVTSGSEANAEVSDSFVLSNVQQRATDCVEVCEHDLVKQTLGEPT